MTSDNIEFADNWTEAEAIANLQQTEDPSLRYYAAWWLGRFRVQKPIVIETLVEALQDETDRSPDGGYPLRRNAAKALGKLGSQMVTPALIDCLDCPDYYVRDSAVRSLEMLEDLRAIPPLIKFLEEGVEKAQKAEGKPHLNQPYEAIIEALGSLGATKAIPLIEPFLEHFTPKVQYASARALYQLTGESQYGERLVKALEGDDLQLRRSALMDLGAVGYVEGAEAIGTTLAENSLKLISLKGLLEAQLERDNQGLQSLSEQTIQVMAIMDNLL